MKKQRKKNERYYQTSSSTTEATRIIKIVLGVVFVLAITYLIAGLITGEIKFGKEKETKTEVSIQYEEILAGETLNRNESDYYVLYINFTDNIASSYITYKDTYLEKENALGFYLVDLEKGFNQSFIAGNEEYSEKPNEIDQLKVKNPTILKISKREVVQRVEGKDAVLSLLQEISKS